MSARVSHRLLAVLLASTALVGVALPCRQRRRRPPCRIRATPPSTGSRRELAADGGVLTSSFDDGMGGVGSFVDYGLTIDAILALAADGRGDEEAATDRRRPRGGQRRGLRHRRRLRSRRPLRRLPRQGAADGAGPRRGPHCLRRLRPRSTRCATALQTSGADAGRFSDLVHPITEFGHDFSNGFGQALAIMALARTGGGVPARGGRPSCSPSSARAAASAATTPTNGGCTADAAATVDATAFALQALVDGRAHLRDPPGGRPTRSRRSSPARTPSGAFGGESGSNANSTGLAAVALRSLGETDGADDAAAFIAGLQLEAGDDLGAVALNAAGLTSAGDGIQILERDGFRRATTQGVPRLRPPDLRRDRRRRDRPWRLHALPGRPAGSRHQGHASRPPRSWRADS